MPAPPLAESVDRNAAASETRWRFVGTARGQPADAVAIDAAGVRGIGFRAMLDAVVTRPIPGTTAVRRREPELTAAGAGADGGAAVAAAALLAAAETDAEVATRRAFRASRSASASASRGRGLDSAAQSSLQSVSSSDFDSAYEHVEAQDSVSSRDVDYAAAPPCGQPYPCTMCRLTTPSPIARFDKLKLAPNEARASAARSAASSASTAASSLSPAVVEFAHAKEKYK